MINNMQTPGVYINELNSFPNSVTPVPTAVPAFIGYTPQASYEGKSYLNVPVQINSFADFQAFFCLPYPPAPASPAKQYSPQYYLVPSATVPASGDYLNINGTYYSVLPDPNTIYYLYNSVRMFYENGGGTAYIVSVGTYGPASGKPMTLGAPLVNPNVKLAELQSGLALLLNEQEPTMYICPEATLLSLAENGTLMESMLLQSSNMGTSVCIFDIIGGNNPDPINYTNDIQNFRNNTGSIGLNYGTAYYPFVETTTMQSGELDYTNLFGGDVSQLATIINPASNPYPDTASILASIQSGSGSMTVQQYNTALMVANASYAQIMNHVLADANVLPPSGAMAGVITTVDNTGGVWKAPANVSIVGVSGLPINLSETQQADLNVDAITGKSVNAIRLFNGFGILVWGARTLDGNSQDWRYLSVRRTMIYIEQSCKMAAQAYVFEPNDANTWASVKAMISSFLNTLWQQGGLQGATPADAFTVDCGLGVTMTAQDILSGFMNVTVKVAVVRPAEFIVFTFQQQQAVSS